MKNLKLATKMFILSSILMISIIVVATVALFRLAGLSSQVSSLVDSTLAKVNLVSDVHVKFLAGVRTQKNAVLSPSDDVSKNHANASRVAMEEATELARQLKELVSKSDSEQQSVEVAEMINALKNAKEVNDQTLDFAVQNTNYKARQLVLTELARQIDQITTRLRTWVDSTASGTPDQSAVARMVSLYQIQSQLDSIIPSIVRHIVSSNEEEMSSWEQKIENALEKIHHELDSASAGNSVSQSEVAANLGEVQSTIARVTKLSRQDTNNKSVFLSLNESKVATDECVSQINDLSRLFEAEAKDGRRRSETAYTDATRAIWVAMLVGLIFGGLFAYMLTVSITNPVLQVRNLSQALADGDLRQRIPLKQLDEVGQLSDATNSLADSLTRIVTQIQKVSESLGGSANDLTGVSNQLLSQSETASIKSASVASASEQLSTNISTMAAAAEEMSVNVASISSASEEMSMNVGTISSAAEQTSNNVGIVSTAVGEISSSFTDVLNDVREGSRIAGQASQMADSATETIQTLSKSGTEISKVTETIKMIALQTNLLALNATIEATSAGEAGKGFAVVAHEIKELANQSAKAAEDIAQRIESVQNDTRQAVQVIQNVSQIVKDINASAGRITGSVEKQTRAATMISQNTVEANKGVSNIARSIAEVAKAAGDMSRNVAEAARGATDVSRNVGEAAKASGGISSDIHGVSVSSKATNQSASKVHESAERLDQISKELKKLVGRFKTKSEDVTEA